MWERREWGEFLMADMVCLSASPSAKQAPVSHTHTDALALIWLLLAAGQATPITVSYYLL